MELKDYILHITKEETILGEKVIKTAKIPLKLFDETAEDLRLFLSETDTSHISMKVEKI